MTQVSLFDGLVHTLERPRERPTGGVNDESADACPVTMPPGAPDDMPAPSPSESIVARCARCCVVLAMASRSAGWSKVLDDSHVCRETQTLRVAEYFRARANRWISGLDLVRLGYGGWRTEISRLRHPPWNMQIGPPRYVPMILANGKRVRISEYRYEP